LVEFIDGLAAAAFTEEDFLNDPIRDRMHLCPAGFHDVYGFMPMAIVDFAEAVVKIFCLKSDNWRALYCQCGTCRQGTWVCST